jgi:ABC-2 type transport system ATP-binding protein
MYDGSLHDIREKYGTSRQLVVEFENEQIVEPIKDVVITDLEDRKKSFSFDSTKVNINDLMNHILHTYQVRDLSIAEPEIESIIQRMYSGEVAV